MSRRRAKSPDAQEPTGQLDLPTMEGWLWEAACAVRGATDAPKFKDYILPLVFYKRLSDVFDDTFAEQARKIGDDATAREIIEADHQDALRTDRKPVVRFYIPQRYNWAAIRNYPADGGLGQFVTDAMRAAAKQNPELLGTVDVIDFNEKQAGQRILDEHRLANMVEVISRHRLGLDNTSPDILGHAYEYLLRKFAEGQGQTAGEFYTPMEVGRLMAMLLDPRPRADAHDPACGSAGLLIKLHQTFRERHTDRRALAPHLFGQERNPATFALARMNMILHGFDGARIAIGDTLRRPQFSGRGSGLKRFDYVVANPMWNQDGYDEAFYDAEELGRFGRGFPTGSSADWGWVQHMLACLNDTGRAAIVLDTGAVSRGSGSKNRNRERDIRRRFVEDDLIEGVILLPENLFYNTSAPGIILLLARRKPPHRRGRIMLVNASTFFEKGAPKNVLTEAGMAEVADVYVNFENREGVARVITSEEAAAADFNLIPSQYVMAMQIKEHRPPTAIISDLNQARRERDQVDRELDDMLEQLIQTKGASG